MEDSEKATLVTPVPYRISKALNARLVTKTSLPNPKKAIAALVLLWFANDKPGRLEYGKDSGKKDEGGILDDEIVRILLKFLGSQNISTDQETMKSLLSDNALFTSQMEALNSAFELVWHLGSFDFADPKRNRSAERMGGKRFRKRISFSTNLDLIDILASENVTAFTQLLFAWLRGDNVAGRFTTLEKRLVRVLGVFSEQSFYKTCKGNEGEIFTPSGIYEQLLEGTASVHISTAKEIQGTTRILNTAVQEGLNPYLAGKSREVRLATDTDLTELQNYTQRAETSLALSEIKLNETIASKKASGMNSLTGIPRNLIFYGAPGTGKSHQLNKMAAENFEKDNMRRVTFYPDYTYSQFVGSYKPYTDSNNDLKYGYVAGPFLDVYLRASTDPTSNYCLVIEEINRANPASVFGDIFQLLDRLPSGFSEYAVAVPSDMHIYIEKYITKRENLGGEELKHKLESLWDDDYQNIHDSMEKDLSLPPNMYIWATMNSADQGVFPMDTAFKRRWDFRYMGIDENENAELEVLDGESLSEHVVSLPDGTRIVWNKLRHAINHLLSNSSNRISEDKWIGPFFLSPESLSDSPYGSKGKSRFVTAFEEKVLLYLYEDAGKMRRPSIFSCGDATFSQVCDVFEERGIDLFRFDSDTRDEIFAEDCSENDGEQPTEA